MNRHLSLGLPLDYHLPALLLIEQGAYWPYLFADASQQPIEALSPYRELAERVGGFVDYRRLKQPDGVDLCGFDDVLVIGAGGIERLAQLDPERLRLVATSDIAALFRVAARGCGVPVAGN
jgi:hypothetical protein